MDEGTIVSFGTLNVTCVYHIPHSSSLPQYADPARTLNSTDDEFLEYVNTNYYRNTSRAAAAKILDLYPADPAAGSPYNTGNEFAYSPQYKRMAAFQGDFFLHAPRRTFVQHLAEKQPVYSYRTSSLVSRRRGRWTILTMRRAVSNVRTVDGIGAVRRLCPCPRLSSQHSLTVRNFQAHGMELADVFGGGPLGDYLIRFAATLDPNGDVAFEWPRYSKAAPLLLTLNDQEPALNLTADTYRAEQMAYLTKLSLADPM